MQQYPKLAYPTVIRTLRKKYAESIEDEFTDSLKPYNQSESLKDFARGVLKCMETLHTTIMQSRDSKPIRNSAFDNLAALKAILHHQLPRSTSPFTVSKLSNELKSVEHLPFSRSFVTELKALLSQQQQLSQAEQQVIQTMCGKPQSSFYSDFYSLLEATQTYFLLIDNKDVPIKNFFDGSYVSYHQQVQNTVQRIKLAKHAYKFHPLYMLPALALMIALLIYMYRHPAGPGQVSKAGLALCGIAVILPILKIIMLTCRDRNVDELQRLEAKTTDLEYDNQLLDALERGEVHRKLK